MLINPFALTNSPIHQLNPRLRIILALLFTILTITCQHPSSLLISLTYTLTLIPLAHLPYKPLFNRLILLNTFMLLLFLTLPFNTSTLTSPLENNIFSPGLHQALLITLKSNTLLLILTTLISTLDNLTLARTLYQLKISPKLIYLLLFTLRYIELIHQEYHRLYQAMKIRGFQPQANWHTYRTFAYLIGLLLTKSFYRAQRILAAMRCRGFHGQFYTTQDPPHFTPSDQIFTYFSSLFLTIILGIEWLI